MFIQLLLGALMIVLTTVVQVIMMGTLDAYFSRIRQTITSDSRTLRNILLISISVLWLVLGITISTFFWAVAFLYVEELKSMEEALYFSIASFTTLGYGDILLSHEWRIFGSISAVNGLIVFGLNTAFLVELMLSTWGKTRKH